jgi:two-component system, OmpR family, phosphate regulon sensor histidine kinase PhoR
VNVRGSDELRVEAERGRLLVEESREIVVVLDEEQRVVGASRRARESLQGLEEGRPLPPELVGIERGATPLSVPYEVDGRRETLLYLSAPGDLAAYEELRAGFTAAVSHELRTPLARLLALLESATLPDAEPHELIEQARAEVEQIDELIGEVLFLSELETGREVVALGSTRVRPVLDEVAGRLADRAARAAVELRIEADPELELPLRRRMLRVVVENLVENAIRYAGDGAHVEVTARQRRGQIVLRVVDDGPGVADEDLPRIFERFYRADRARASRGTGLGLAIVKHVVTSAGGIVEARRVRPRGLDVRCTFPVA